MAASETTCALNNYTKGDIIVLDGEPNQHFPDLPSNTINVKVKPGSKIRNLIGFAKKMLQDDVNRHMLVMGSGDAMYKAISCTEILKRKYKNLHQITKISYLRLEEYWEPKDKELDRLKVLREIPQICILLSKDSLDSNEPGYQAPGDYNSMWADKTSPKKRKWRESKPKFQRHSAKSSTDGNAFYRKAKSSTTQTQTKDEA